MKPLNFAIILLLAGTSLANGKIEINQLCVSTGCFAGDDSSFPVEISEPGSYRLTSNLLVGGLGDPVAGIHIFASRVTLDLGGSVVEGP